MSAPDAYWTQVAKQSQQAQAKEAGREADFHRSARNGVFRMKHMWERQYKERIRGKKVMCLTCNQPRPKSHFVVLKTGYIQSQCRACKKKRVHRKKAVLS